MLEGRKSYEGRRHLLSVFSYVEGTCIHQLLQINKRSSIELGVWESSPTVSVLRYFNSVTKEWKCLPFLIGNLWAEFCMPGTVLGAPYSFYVITATLWGRYFYTHFYGCGIWGLEDGLVCPVLCSGWVASVPVLFPISHTLWLVILTKRFNNDLLAFGYSPSYFCWISSEVLDPVAHPSLRSGEASWAQSYPSWLWGYSCALPLTTVLLNVKTQGYKWEPASLPHTDGGHCLPGHTIKLCKAALSFLNFASLSWRERDSQVTWGPTLGSAVSGNQGCCLVQLQKVSC